MALSRLYSSAFVGLDALLVEVEVDAFECDNPGLVIVGLPDSAVRESKDRIVAAIRNTGYSIGSIRCTINLAPGDLKKEGSLYDLPMALGLLRSLKSIGKQEWHSDYLIIGEMGLSGEIRSVCGALAMAMLAKSLGKRGIILPAANAKEAASVPGLDIIAIQHLRDAVQFFQNPTSIKPVSLTLPSDLFASNPAAIDFADVRGQTQAKRAMEIAAAGGHNVVLSGPPGSGKTMLAKALISIMPDLTLEEALEITKIHSVAGLLPEGQSLVTQRPFRSPHHTVSYAGLIGGGMIPRPGEVSLAHRGILFLDELPEFSRLALEVLRQPLEDRKVTISRANGSLTFPSDFICLAAMNPCPCGFLGQPGKTCRDSDIQVQRYRGKISGPFWDRIDMSLEVPILRYHDLLAAPTGESSATVRRRVVRAREIQQHRFQKVAKTNGQMSSREVKQFVPIGSECHAVLRQAVDHMGISARACDRLLRVARTIADLEGAKDVQAAHLMEALSYKH